MAHPIYPQPVQFGFLSICEGIILSLVTGWWLQSHGQPPTVFVGVAVMVSALYFAWLSIGSGSALTAPVVILSVALWAAFGWFVGEYALVALTKSHAATTTLVDTPIVWKVMGAVLLGFLAYCDKTTITRDRAY